MISILKNVTEREKNMKQLTKKEKKLLSERREHGGE